jgi:hypothetical protein
MEKLAGSLGESRLVSEMAWKRLSGLAESRSAGQHELPGFGGPFSFYAV